MSIKFLFSITITFLTIYLNVSCSKSSSNNCTLLTDCGVEKCFYYFVVWEELKREMIFKQSQRGQGIKDNLGCAFPEKIFDEAGIVLELWNREHEEYFEVNDNFTVPNNSKINIKEILNITINQGGRYSNFNIIYPKNITKDKTEQALRSELLKFYDKSVWPWMEMKSSCFVLTNIMFNKIIDVDLFLGSLSMLVWFRLRWNDPRFTWDPEDWNKIKILYLEPDEFWDPDIEIWNSLDSIEKFFQPQAAYVDYKGDLFWSRMGQIHISCDMNSLGEFPYDTSECQFEVGSWTYDSDKVTMGFDGTGYELNEKITSKKNAPFAQYNIKSVTAENYSLAYPQIDDKWPAIKYNVALNRNHKQYTYGIIVPQALLTFISFGAFWLPPSSGERIGFTITIPLAISVYKLLMYQQLPASNQLVFATKFSFGCFFFTIFVVIESTFAAMLWWRTDPYFLSPWQSFKKLNIDMKVNKYWVDVIRAVDVEMAQTIQQSNNDLVQQNLESLPQRQSQQISDRNNTTQNKNQYKSVNDLQVEHSQQSDDFVKSYQISKQQVIQEISSSSTIENFDQFADAEAQNITQNITFPLQNVKHARNFLWYVLDNKQYEYARKSYKRLCDTYSEQDVQRDLFRMMGVVDGAVSDFGKAAKIKYNDNWRKLSNLVDRICQFIVVPSFILFVFIISFQADD